MHEKRGPPRIRRDLNDLVRDESGRLSPTKVGTLIGQWLAIKLILENGKDLIASWDAMVVLFSVLIAPELIRKIVNTKYGFAEVTRTRPAPKPTAAASVKVTV